MKLASKVRQIRDKLGKVITVPRTPMQRLKCWFNISKWKASTVFILHFIMNKNCLTQNFVYIFYVSCVFVFKAIANIELENTILIKQ